MHPPQVGQLISCTIDGFGSSGEGVGHYNGYTLFIDGALPGEVVQVKLTECHKRYAKARLFRIITASDDRVDPPCPLFGKCGGCQLMHLSYPKQLEMKRKRVSDALVRIGKIQNVEVPPCLPSPETLSYRNKIQLPVRKTQTGTALGLYAKGSHHLVELEGCLIHSPLGESVYKEVRKQLLASLIAPYDPETGTGQLRHVLIRTALKREEVLLIFVTNQAPNKALLELAQTIMGAHSAIKGVVHNKQEGRDNLILGKEYTVLCGSGSIQERLSHLTFTISPASFFQINPAQAEIVYAKAIEYAALSGEETVLDAYCGVGTLSLFFAQSAKQVIGVESVPEAIEDAQANALCNGIENTRFVAQTAETFIETLSNIDLVLLNPPRSGCETAFLDGIGRLLPQKLIYISCDPATLARDIAYLGKFGYNLSLIQPYDMFPQTAHVESVSLLLLS